VKEPIETLVRTLLCCLQYISYYQQALIHTGMVCLVCDYGVMGS
jgi:hypothetical protein